MTWAATKASTTTRLLVWVLAISIALLSGTSLQKRYHCRITGATSSSCCCKEPATSCPGAATCAKRTCCSNGSASTGSDGMTSDSGCDCCNVTYQRTARDAVRVDPHGSADAQGSGGHKRIAHAVDPISPTPPDLTAIWRPPDAAQRAWSGPPVYLLNCVFLI